MDGDGLLAALAATVVLSLSLALLLWVRARAMEGSGLLALFLISVAVFVAGQVAPLIWGVDAQVFSAITFSMAPLGSAIFVNFVLVFLGVAVNKRVIIGLYLLAALGGVVSLLLGAGRIQPWISFPAFFLPDRGGMIAALTSVLLSIGGHLIIPLRWHHVSKGRQRQAAALGLSFFWGMVCVGGFIVPALRLTVFPVPLLLLPSYALVLVYGLLRYRLMEINLWARRALATALLAILLMIGAALISGWVVAGKDSFWRIWAAFFGVLAISALLWPRVRWVADRLILGDGQVTRELLAEWHQRLDAAPDLTTLLLEAQHLLSTLIRARTCVTLSPNPSGGLPTIVLGRSKDGWTTQWLGWDGAPPGPQVAAAVLAELLVEAAHRLDHIEDIRVQERDRQNTERLAELGALAATVAHDLRNPLNIISMAAVIAPPDVRQEITAQVSRMSHLIGDLLDYAKPWSVTKHALDLADWCQDFAASAEVTVPSGLIVAADAKRLSQAMVNLLTNASKAAQRIAIIGEEHSDGSITLDICDDGPGIPDDIRANLFQPFVSRSPDGTGLGLSIVAKVMIAHGGTATLGHRPGWATCITLRFPPGAIP